MMSIRHSITLSLLGLSAGGIAAAADAPPTTVIEDNGPITTVTVTAQHRTEASQDVPISLQVVNSVQLEKLQASNLAQMSGYIPGLTVDGEQPTQPGYSLRGISVTDFGIGTDSPIGIYQDGVYAGKTGGALLLFNDVDRIEVLKGPQGTLFGRNSAAGAISVLSNAPTDTFAASALGRWGNYGEQYYEGMVNAPLTDTLDARISFVSNRSDGWMQDAATGLRYDRNGDWGGRAQLLWRAPGDTTFRLIYEYENLAQPARPALSVVSLPPSPELPPTNPSPSTYISPFNSPLLSDTVNPRESRTYNGLTLRAEHSFSFGDLASISSWRQFATYNREEQDGTNRSYLYFDDVNIEQNLSFSQEFTLSGKTQLADWVAGASYFYNDAHQDSQVNLLTDSIDTLALNEGSPIPPYAYLTSIAQGFGIPVSLNGLPWAENMYNHLFARAEAAYGDVIWHVASGWNLTTGVRFTHDEKDFSWYNPERTATQLDTNLGILAGYGIGFGGAFDPTQNLIFNTQSSLYSPLRTHESWNDTSPRVVLDYKPSSSLMYYLSYSKGYEAGGFNALSPGAEYSPEHVNNYELGFKSELFDRRLLVNASAYYYVYSNLQQLQLVSPPNELPQYQVTISDQHAWGVDFETHWQATDALRVNFVAAYIDSTYKDYTAPDGTYLNGQATGVPFWSLAGGIDYLVRDVVGGDIDATLQDAYQGPGRCNADSQAQGSCLSIPTFRTGTSTNRTDARLAWTSHGRVPITVAGYVNNVFDKQYVTGVQTISAATLGTPFANITAPRFWGMELSAKF